MCINLLGKRKLKLEY